MKTKQYGRTVPGFFALAPFATSNPTRFFAVGMCFVPVDTPSATPLR